MEVGDGHRHVGARVLHRDGPRARRALGLIRQSLTGDDGPTYRHAHVNAVVVTATGSPSIWSAGLAIVPIITWSTSGVNVFSAGTTDTTSPSRTRQHHARHRQSDEQREAGRRPVLAYFSLSVFSRSPKSARRVNRSRHWLRPPAFAGRTVAAVATGCPASNERRYRRCTAPASPHVPWQGGVSYGVVAAPEALSHIRYSTLREDTRRCAVTTVATDAGRVHASAATPPLPPSVPQPGGAASPPVPP